MEALGLLFIVFALYFAPFAIAYYRGKEPLAIFLLNLFLGWTLVGWVAALVWAATGTAKASLQTKNPIEPWVKPPTGQQAAKHAQATEKPNNAKTSIVAPSLEPQFRRISGRAFKRASGLGLAVGSNGDEGAGTAENGSAMEPALAHIAYTNASGEQSERLLTLRRLSEGRENQKLLQAFCHLRSEVRSFRLDRIDALADVTTGEVFEDPEEIENWIHNRIPADLGPALNGLTVLSFMAAADDHISDEEIAIMAKFASQVAPGVSIPADFAQRVARFTPDPEAVKLALTAIAKTSHAKTFEAALQQIVDSDGHLHPAEIQAIAFLQLGVEYV